MKNVILGFDPGKVNGALATLVNGVPDLILPFPKVDLSKNKEEVDYEDLLSIVKMVKDNSDSLIMVVEKVHAFQKSGASSSFNFGYICGFLRGIAMGLDIRLELVHPIRWQNVVCEGVPYSYDKKGKKDTKARALTTATNLYPDVDLYDPTKRRDKRSKPHDGMVDALLIATYGYKTFC